MATHVVSQIEQVPTKQVIDREKVCPLLLRIFCANGHHNSPQEYNRGLTPHNELQIYTWMDCTLRELVTLIKDVNPEARKRGTEYRFATVTPNPRMPRFTFTDVGVCVNGERSGDDSKTLSSCNFAVGDFIDVAIVPPGSAPVQSYRNGNDRRFSGGQHFDRPMRRYGSFRDGGNYRDRDNFRD